MHMAVAGDKITGKCDSCPFVGDLDSKHRLAAFIFKNPPQAKNMATGKTIKVEISKLTPAQMVAKTAKKEKQDK